MKNIIRIISILIMAVMLSTVLCSCTQLDDLKNNRGIWLNEKQTEVMFRDNLYKQIDLKGDAIFQSESYSGVLTTPDVPVLLSRSEGKSLYFDKTADIPIILEQTDYYYSESKYMGAKYYCLESEYDRISDIVDNKRYDSMYIEYDKKFTDYENNYDFQKECEIISEEYQDAIDRVLESADGTILESKDESKHEKMDIARCDSDMLITNNVNIHIAYIDNEYYVQESTDYRFKKVPENEKEIFKKMFKEYDEKGAVYTTYNPQMIEGY